MFYRNGFPSHRWLSPPAAALVLAGAAGWYTAAAAENRTWSANGRGANIVLTDCRDCGDDIGIMITCKGPGQPAEVIVQWAAWRDGVEGLEAPITFQIGSEKFSFPAKASRMDAIGFPPVFRLNPGDALLPALQAGRQANVQFGSASNTIALSGARAAIDTFKANCGWNQGALPMQNAGQGMMAQPNFSPGSSNGVVSAPVQIAQSQQLAGAHVTVEINNKLSVPVDYYEIDQAGDPQFLYSLKPGEEVDQPSLAGTVLVFGVNGQQFASYTTSANPQQVFDVRAPGSPQSVAASPPPRSLTMAAAPANGGLELTDEDGAIWHFSQSTVSATAVFGIPETDATSVAIFCKRGAPAVMEFFAAPTRDWGTKVGMTLASGGNVFAQTAKANKERRLEATLDDSSRALRRAMTGAERVTITVGGKPAGRFLGLGSSASGRSFLNSCPQFAG